MGLFQEYIDYRNSFQGEALKTINKIQRILDDTMPPKKDGFGINEIKFDFINEQQSTNGVQLNMELKGSAIARNHDHVVKMLRDLVKSSREKLWQEKIFFEIKYHEIYISDVKHENFDHNLYFYAKCAAIVFF